jgi:hypothetical protein
LSAPLGAQLRVDRAASLAECGDAQGHEESDADDVFDWADAVVRHEGAARPAKPASSSP